MTDRPAILTFSGFRQHGRAVNGSEVLRNEIEDHVGHLPGVYVAPVETWQADVSDIMGEVLRRYTSVIILSHSHGSYTALKAAQIARKAGRRIRMMAINDGVFRPLWLPPWTWTQLFAFRSLLPHAAHLNIPDNVDAVLSVHQRQGVPMGHPIRLQDPTQTRIIENRELRLSHAEIDDSPAWRAMVIAELSKLFVS